MHINELHPSTSRTTSSGKAKLRIADYDGSGQEPFHTGTKAKHGSKQESLKKRIQNPVTFMKLTQKGESMKNHYLSLWRSLLAEYKQDAWASSFVKKQITYWKRQK